jgi:NADPH:quinone reductase-like Zn-dependent oxidoreductase
MKSYHLSYGGGIEGLVLREHDFPKPGPGQVLVRVGATSLNARELMILRGDYPLPVSPMWWRCLMAPAKWSISVKALRG